MKRFITFLSFISGLCMVQRLNSRVSDSTITIPSETVSIQKIIDPQALSKHNSDSKGKKRISFNFKNEDLTTIINYLTAEKHLNVILPMPPNNITTKITLYHQKKMSLDDAFDRLHTLLDVAGFTLVPHGKDTLRVVRTDANTLREPLHVYIGIAPEDLPDTDETIRFLYYFDNIKIPRDPGDRALDEIKKLLEEMLNDPSKPGSFSITFDSPSNSVLLTAKSHHIKTAMQIVQELDKTGFREAVEVIRLAHTSAGFVGKFLIEQLLAPSAAEKNASAAIPPSFDTSYFTKSTKIIPDTRTNSLIILGRAQAITRLKEFIYKYIDIPLESGDSIVHVYALQYLDAPTFAETLKKIIESSAEVPGQAKGTAPEQRAFQGVIIEAEKITETQKLKADEVGTAVQGGNRLLVAAKKNDWINVKRLIEELDKPQPQVALDVLIVDINATDNNLLASHLRNKDGLFPKEFNAQFAGMDTPVTDNTPNVPSTLMANLARVKTVNSELGNIASTAAIGSTVLSFKDTAVSGMWLVTEMLKKFTTSRILSRPHIVVLNHQQAKISIAIEKLVRGPIKTGPDGNPIAQQVPVTAKLEVFILPRINLSKTIDLKIAVNVENFIGDSDDKTSRMVTTNATIGDGEVLVLGGLVKTKETDDTAGVPLLSKIPLFGWLVNKKGRDNTKDNLMIFINPVVVKPKVGGGMSGPSTEKFAQARHEVEDSTLFEHVHDPITHWFFASPKDSALDLTKDYEVGAMFSKQPLKGETFFQKQEQPPAPPAPQPEKREPKKKRRIKKLTDAFDDQEQEIDIHANSFYGTKPVPIRLSL